MRTWRIWPSHQKVKGKGPLQMNNWKNSTNFDVQQQHNLYFCLKIDRTDIEPEKKCRKSEDTSTTIHITNINLYSKIENKTYFSCIMNNGKIRARQFWLDETSVIFECLIKLLWKCFMSCLWKHTVKRSANQISHLYIYIYNLKIKKKWTAL